MSRLGLVSLSETAIYFSDDNVIFILNVPLVYESELTLFHLIHIPICQNNKCVILNSVIIFELQVGQKIYI